VDVPPAPDALTSISSDISDSDFFDATKVTAHSVQLRRHDGRSRASRPKAEQQDPGAFDPDEPGARLMDGAHLLSASQLDVAIKNEGGHYTMARSFVERVLQQQESAIAGARAVLYEHDGRVVGVKLSGIRRSGLLAKLGLQNGDLLKSISGYELTTLDDALDAYAKLRNAPRLSLAIVRRERAMTLGYSIEP
jgi:general secretion pathway protein C